MNSKILNKLDEITSIIDECELITRISFLKTKIFEDKKLLDKIKLIQDDSIKYGNNYINIKKEILANPYFKEYKEIETELYFLTKEINDRLKSLIKGD
ncbi:MAG: YlbF family regulator [Bacilli bacterium]|nr:YlbF family regulator [Bacilli bacterium]